MISLSPVVRREFSGSGFLVRELEYASGHRQPPHTHDIDGITLIVAGDLRETVRNREEEATSLSVVVKPAGVVHSDEIGPRGARTVQVSFPSGLDGFLRGSDVSLGRWRWLHGGPGVRELLSLHRALRGVHGGDGSELEGWVLDLLGEIGGGEAPTAGGAPLWLERAKQSLDAGVTDGIRVSDVAAEAGVHPVSLTRAFRRHYGVTVSGYRRRERLRRAAAAVVQTEWSLTRVAHESGFVDHAHMCREVRSATGLTPSQLRHLSR